jgi:hypothetical protein
VITHWAVQSPVKPETPQVAPTWPHYARSQIPAKHDNELTLMNIANVNFHDHGFMIHETVAHYDRSFFTATPTDWRSKCIDIHFFLKTDSSPELHLCNTPVYSCDCLHIYNLRNNYLFVVKNPYTEQVSWTATFIRNSCNVIIHLYDNSVRDLFVNFVPVLYQTVLTFVLAQQHGALVHSAGAGIDGNGFIFTGHSDVGKSTLARLFEPYRTIIPISDERVAVRSSVHGFSIFGTPWHSDAKIARNACFPLKAIFFLHQGGENNISPCTLSKSVRQFLPQIMIPWYDTEYVQRLMDMSEKILEAVPAFDFHFRPDESAVECVLDFAKTIRL